MDLRRLFSRHREVPEALGKRMGDSPKAYANVEIVARHADGTEFARRIVHNMLVTTGESYISGLLSGGVGNTGAMKAVGIGTGSTAEATTQTALVTEVETRQNGTQSLVTTTHTNDTYLRVPSSKPACSTPPRLPVASWQHGRSSASSTWRRMIPSL